MKASSSITPNVVTQWFRRNFSDASVTSLLIVLIALILVLEFFGNILAPIILSIVIAYMLQSVVSRLERFKLPHIFSVLIVFLFFIGLLIFALVWLLPLLSKQLVSLINQMPNAFADAKQYLLHLKQGLPKTIAPSELQHVISILQAQAGKVGAKIFSFSLATIPGLISIILYLVLVPVMVFFFLKDSAKLLSWSRRFMPAHRQALDTVWGKVHLQIGQYVKGRVIEIFIVAVISGIVFSLLGLHYALLLALIVGLSVIVPYLGAVVATIPIVFVGLMQWGMSAHFAYLIISFSVIFFLDGYVLVPLLFAETMNLHPIAIIIAILLFGGVWGFWGVFFAIPLATLVKAILDLWPMLESEAEHAIVGEND